MLSLSKYDVTHRLGGVLVRMIVPGRCPHLPHKSMTIEQI
jgi:hypothetical protein